jgi:uncharacterized protein (TIGR02145 family)
MKAIRKIGMWKAIAFLTVVISMFSCTSCDPDLNLKPQVTIGIAENVHQTSATLVASIIPNGDNIVILFEYQANNSTWKSQTLTSTVSGSKAIKLTLDLSDLQPSTLYNFRVTAGSVTSSTSSFITEGLTLAVIKIKSAENVKISTASLTASVVPNQDNTSISFEYQTANSAWVSKSLGSTFSGTDSVKVNFDLSNLQVNTLYNFRVKVSNKAGEVVSNTTSFTTYAAVDYDGNLYHTVTIGTQTWLKENFKGSHYANGDAIVNVTDQTTWANQTTGAYCYYNNNSENGKVYGGLYNWYVASDSRGLVVGYHTSSYNDWETLKSYLGGITAGGALKETGLTHWVAPNDGATNSSGFTGLPGGIRSGSVFSNLGDGGGFWTSTVYPIGGMAYGYDLGESSTRLGNGGDSYYYGLSLRLIKN